MKLQTDDLLATTAIALGVGQMLAHMKNVYEKDDVSSYDATSVFIGITASSLWLLYQFRKGANYSAVYTSIGLVAQLYILQRISSKAKEETKKDIHSMI
jgi:hypothetical protein